MQAAKSNIKSCLYPGQAFVQLVPASRTNITRSRPYKLQRLLQKRNSVLKVIVFLFVAILQPHILLAQIENSHWIVRPNRIVNPQTFPTELNLIPPARAVANGTNMWLDYHTASLSKCDSELVFYCNDGDLRHANHTLLSTNYHFNPRYIIDASADSNIVYLISTGTMSTSSGFNQTTLIYDSNWQLLSSTHSTLLSLSNHYHEFELIRKPIGEGYWLIVSNLAQAGFLVYEWQNGQVSQNPIDSINLRPTRTFVPTPWFISTGHIRVSPSGNRLVIQRNDNRTISFVNFDPIAGRFQAELQLDFSNAGYFNPENALFSTDGNKFYAATADNLSSPQNKFLLQCDLSTYDSLSVLNSLRIVYSYSYPSGSAWQAANHLITYGNSGELILFRRVIQNSPSRQYFEVDLLLNPNAPASAVIYNEAVHAFSQYSYPQSPSMYTYRHYQLPQLYLSDRFKIRAPESACPNDTITFRLGDYLNVHSVQWDYGDGQGRSAVNKRIGSKVYTQPGTYTITAYFDYCNQSDSIQHVLVIHGEPEVQSFTDTAFCVGGNLQLSASSLPTNTVLWSNGNTALTSSFNTPGWHWVEISNPCFSRRDSFLLVIQEPPVSGLALEINACEGEVLPLVPQGGNYQWEWQNGSTDTLNVSISGTYLVRMTNACGSFEESVRVHFREVPILNLQDTTLCGGQVYQIDLPTFWEASYLWYDGSEERSRILTEKGNYWVQINNPCGIINDTFDLTFKNCPCDLYLPNAFTPNGDGLNDALKIFTACELSHFQLEVYDRWGRRVFVGNDLSQGWDGFFEGNLLPAGSYPFVVRYTPQGLNPRLEKGMVQLLR